MKDTYIYVGEKIIMDNSYIGVMSIYKTISDKNYTAYIEGTDNNKKFVEDNDVVFLGEDVFNRLSVIRSKTESESEYGLSDDTIEVLKTTFLNLENKGLLNSVARNIKK